MDNVSNRFPRELKRGISVDRRKRRWLRGSMRMDSFDRAARVKKKKDGEVTKEKLPTVGTKSGSHRVCEIPVSVGKGQAMGVQGRGRKSMRNSVETIDQLGLVFHPPNREFPGR